VPAHLVLILFCLPLSAYVCLYLPLSS
jgi:hypothetical protein